MSLKYKVTLIFLFCIVILNIQYGKLNGNIHSDKKTSAVLTGKAAEAMKNDPEISNMIIKTSYLVTNTLVAKKGQRNYYSKNQLIRKRF